MARYVGPVCRLCRRQDEKLMLKGERCLTPKCPLERRHVPPGEQHRRPRKVSEYGIRLREKQKARRIYGVLERQFRRHFAEAGRRPGSTGENLLKILEMRLDNAVYRLGFADSRNQARQLVRHGHLTVNGRKVNIPSYLVKPGDAIAWREKSKQLAHYEKAAQEVGSRSTPSWMSLDPETLIGRVLTEPNRDEIESIIDEHLIVEYYSR
jgi:small subunit ribosomal protein S4